MSWWIGRLNPASFAGFPREYGSRWKPAFGFRRLLCFRLSLWQSFGSWIRTVRPGLAPSEQVVAIALRHTLPEFLASTAKPSILVKFIRDRLERIEPCDTLNRRHR